MPRCAAARTWGGAELGAGLARVGGMEVAGPDVNRTGWMGHKSAPGSETTVIPVLNHGICLALSSYVGWSMNIRSAKVDQLVQRLARLTGEDVETALERAVEE